MNLGILSCSEVITPKHIALIDKICLHLWDSPNTVRFYNLITDSNSCSEISSWAELYFGCKFVLDSPRKLTRTSGSMSLSRSSNSSSRSSTPRSNTPSPRPDSSPRLIPSPRKLSVAASNNIRVLVSCCSHIVVIDTHDQINLVLKTLGDLPVVVISNL